MKNDIIITSIRDIYSNQIREDLFEEIFFEKNIVQIREILSIDVAGSIYLRFISV